MKNHVACLIAYAIPTAAHLPSCFHVKFIDAAAGNYFSSVLSGLLPGWLSSLPLHLTALVQHPMTTKQRCVGRGTPAELLALDRCALFLLFRSEKTEIFQRH